MKYCIIILIVFLISHGNVSAQILQPKLPPKPPIVEDTTQMLFCTSKDTMMMVINGDLRKAECHAVMFGRGKVMVLFVGDTEPRIFDRKKISIK